MGSIGPEEAVESRGNSIQLMSSLVFVVVF